MEKTSDRKPKVANSPWLPEEKKLALETPGVSPLPKKQTID